MSNDTTTVKPGGSAEFKLTPKTDLDNSVEVFNAADLQTKAGALETAFSEFAQILGEVNTYVNAEVNTSHDKCVFGPGYGTQLLKLWNDNASTFGDFHANFESWSQAIAIIANKNSQTEVDIRAIYGDRGDTITAFDENGITNESIAAMRERINLEDTALNDFGGNSYTYYDENGNLISVQKDANGNIVGRIIRDANGNIISETYTDSDGNYAVITYDADGNPVVTYYDKDGNVLTTKPDSFNTDGTLTEAEKKELGVPENPTQEEIDELGYDPSKWDENGINRETGTPYDSEGYDVNGYDANGYNREGFNANGIHKDTGTEFGPDGYNQDGFNEQGIHKETGSQYGPDGYDANGYDREGFDANGFDKSGINKETGDFYDKNGYDVNGYDKEGYNKDGFNKDGIHKETGNEFGPDGYNKDGYNQEGYDRDGYDVNGYDKDGYDKDGFSAGGVHKDTGTPYGPDGYNKDGYNQDGYNRQGYDKDGYDKDGYDYEGWDKDGVHKETGNEYGPDGYNKDGYDENGFDRDGYDKDGLDQDGNPRPEADGGLEDGQEAGTEGGVEEGTEGGSEGDTEGGSEGDTEGGSEGDTEGGSETGTESETTAETAGYAGYGSDKGKIPEDAIVTEVDSFGGEEGVKAVSWQKDNGEYVTVLFDKDGNEVSAVVSDEPFDPNNPNYDSVTEWSDGEGNEYDKGDYESILTDDPESLGGDGSTGDMDNDGIPDSEDMYYDDTGVETTANVTISSGDRVTVNGNEYNVYGFTKTVDGRVVTMYADKEGYLYYQDASGNIQQVLEQYGKKSGSGNYAFNVYETKPATIGSVDATNPGAYADVPSSLLVGDVKINESSDIIGTATFENDSLAGNVTITDSNGSAYTNINVDNSITTDGSVLQSYEGNVNQVVNGDTVVTASSMSDFSSYVTSNPDANIVIRIPQGQTIQWDPSNGWGNGYDFNTSNGNVYLKWNSSENGYQICDQYGNITNTKVFTLDGFNTTYGKWK